MNAVLYRLGRLRAAVSSLRTYDLNVHRRTPQNIRRPAQPCIEYRGGIRRPEYDNELNSVPLNIAGFRLELIKWAKESSKGTSEIEDAFKASFPLRVMLDLRDSDQHPYPRRNGGESRVDPGLTDTKPRLQLRARAGEASCVVIGRDGQWKTSTPGNVAIVTTGDVIDSKGNKIGDFDDLANRAIRDLEHLLRQLRLIS